MSRSLRILIWHVHGGWTDAFVRGRHDYFLPLLPEGGGWGLGRAGRPWSESVRELGPEELRAEPVDVVVLQRPEELERVVQWLGRRPGRDLPAIYLEHNTPPLGRSWRHPLADDVSIPLVHVTNFNQLMWDTGSTPTTVIEHGIPDPGDRYTGELARAAVVVNEPVRRGRVTGTDLLPALAAAAPIDVFGMGLDQLNSHTGVGPDRLNPVGDLPSGRLHAEMALRRVYVHPVRWTSLGLSLLEAMTLGMPVVGLATTEAVMAVPPEAGVLSTRVAELATALRSLINEPEHAAQVGKQAREFALAHYGLPAFLRRWDELLEQVAAE